MHLAKLLALALGATALAACHRTSDVPPKFAASPSTILVGTTPAAPTGDPPGTTPVASNTTTLSKQQETQGGPREGDNHSYSSLASSTPQKAHGQDGGPNRSGSNGSQS